MRQLIQQAKYTLWAIFNPASIKPTASFETFKELTIPSDTRLVILDKDNTFAEPHKLTVFPSYQSRWAQLLAESSSKGYQVVVLSNTAGDESHDPSGVLAKELEQSLQIPVIKHALKKPMCYKEVVDHFAGQGIKPHEIYIVGDRLVTDVLMANLMGAKSAWIRPGLHPNWLNRIEMYLGPRQ